MKYPLHDLMSWSAIGIGFFAAVLWWKASVVKVRTEDYVAKLRAKGVIGPSERPFLMTEGPFDVIQSIKASGTWNAWAAASTALSVLLQAGANLLTQLR